MRPSTGGHRGNSRSHACRPYEVEHRTPSAVAPRNISWRPRSQFLDQFAVPSGTKTSPTSQKHEYSLKTLIASSPSLLGEQRFEAPSAHPRYPRGDGFLAWASKRKEKLAAARTRRRKLSLLSILVGVCQRGVAWLAALFRFPTYLNNNAPFPR